MPRLLPLRGDSEHRLICSECRKEYGDDLKRTWVFQRYKGPDGNQVVEVDWFELRRLDGVVQWRTLDRPDKQWLRFPGGTVFCSDANCSVQRIGNYRVFDPETDFEGEL